MRDELIFSEYELRAIDSDDEESDIVEDFARPLTVDIGEGEDEDGTSASNSSAQFRPATRLELAIDEEAKPGTRS